ncbi:hypothetical protein BC835DRAFT_482747 [Cytidiella melzeri]|nr:hypothetical protein BC835DRAFT_482747 [Cytidiella melzeri]
MDVGETLLASRTEYSVSSDNGAPRFFICGCGHVLEDTRLFALGGGSAPTNDYLLTVGLLRCSSHPREKMPSQLQRTVIGTIRAHPINLLKLTQLSMLVINTRQGYGIRYTSTCTSGRMHARLGATYRRLNLLDFRGVRESLCIGFPPSPVRVMPEINFLVHLSIRCHRISAITRTQPSPHPTVKRGGRSGDR